MHLPTVVCALIVGFALVDAGDRYEKDCAIGEDNTKRIYEEIVNMLGFEGNIPASTTPPITITGSKLLKPEEMTAGIFGALYFYCDSDDAVFRFTSNRDIKISVDFQPTGDDTTKCQSTQTLTLRGDNHSGEYLARVDYIEIAPASCEKLVQAKSFGVFKTTKKFRKSLGEYYKKQLKAALEKSGSFKV